MIIDKVHFLKEEFKSHRSYWENCFSNPLVGRYFQNILSSNEVSGHATVYLEVSQLKDLDPRQRFIFSVAALSFLLGKSSMTNSVIVESPRVNAGTPTGAGASCIPVRINLPSAPSMLKDYLNGVQSVFNEAYRYQSIPLHVISEDYKDKLSSNVLVVDEELHAYSGETTEYDLVLVSKRSGTLSITVRSSSLYSGFANDFGSCLHTAIVSIIGNTQKDFDTIEYLSGELFARIKESLYGPVTDWAVDTTVHSLIEKQRAIRPDAVAICFGDEYVTYDALMSRVDVVSSYLCSLGLSAEERIGVFMNRSVEMIVSILGIMKAGAAYVPMDITLPATRIDFIRQDAAIRFCMIDGMTIHPIKDIQFEALIDVREVYTYESTGGSITMPAKLAYIIYTSGSTGTPKGVMVDHPGVINRLLWGQDYFRLDSADIVMHKTSIGFDVSVWEMFWPLTSGACLYVLQPGVQNDSHALLEVIIKHAITTIHFVPSMLDVFLEYLDGKIELSLSRVLCSGEALEFNHITHFREKLGNVRLFNLYGPTEASIEVSVWEAPQKPGMISCIGVPISNTGLYVLSESGELLPPGFLGEIHIAGIQLARGYLNRPDLTANSFITGSNSLILGKRMYRTGDLGFTDNQGHIFFKGRKDNQVKVNGFRIELQEIESQICNVDGVLKAVVTFTKDNDGTANLAGYFTGKATSPMVLQFLRNTLPPYMVPAQVYHVDEFPMTSSGKIDRNKLGTLNTVGHDIKLPTSRLEKKIYEVWAEVLRIPSFDIEANFFDLGGHSLKAGRVVSRIVKELGIPVTISDFFEAPTVRQLAHIISLKRSVSGNALNPATVAEDYTVAPQQRGLWIMWNLDRSSTAYVMTWNVTIRGALNESLLVDGFRKLIERHEILRTVFRLSPTGVRQVILPAKDVVTNVIHLIKNNVLGDYNKEQAARKLSGEILDLENGPLFKVEIYRYDNNLFNMVLAIHHIITDGWSMENMVLEVMRHYTHPGEVGNIPAIQYKDIIEFEYNSGHDKSSIAKSREYWHDLFKDLRNKSSAKHNFRMFARHGRQAAHVTSDVPAALTSSLRSLAKQERASLFMIFLAAINVLIQRYTGGSDNIIGVPIAGRERFESEDQLGFFVRTLPIRTSFTRANTPLEVLAITRRAVLEALVHQAYPLDEMVEELGMVRQAGISPLFDVMLVYQDPDNSSIESFSKVTGLEIDSRKVNVNETRFNLKFEIKEQQDSLKIDLELSAHEDDERIAIGLCSHLINVLSVFASGSAVPVQSLQYLSREEKNTLMKFSERYTGVTVAGSLPTPVVVLNDDLELMPVGLTGKVFTSSGVPTGLRARWSYNGDLEIRGNDADYVTIDGVEVNLNKIEKALLDTGFIRDCIVVRSGERLTAFVEVIEGNDASSIMASVKDLLAVEFPSEIHVVDRLGSDRSPRPALTSLLKRVRNVGGSVNQPGEDVVNILLDIWKRLLVRKQLSTTDNFFFVGGHSLLGIQMIGEVKARIGLEFTLNELFTNPTIEALSKVLSRRTRTAIKRIEPAPLQMSYSLSHAQQRMWMLSEFDPTSSVYNLGRAYDVNGSLNVEAVSKSFDLLVERHEILRTVFKVDSGEASQQVLDKTSCGFKLDYRDLIESSDQSSECDRLVSDILYRPYSLSGELLFRVLLVRRSGGSYVLAFGMHHIISDGWSLDILFRESMSFYTSLIRGLPLSKRPLAIHYKDYSYWQQDELNSSSIDASRRYWHEEFSGGVPVVDIYSDRPRPQVMSHRGDVHCFWLDEELSDGIRSRCSQAGSSLYIYIMSVIRVLLYRHSGQRDIVIGSPMTGRTHPDLEDQIGFYVNTLALRGEVLEEETFGQLLGRMRDKMLLSYEHQVYPFDLLVEELKVERDMSRSPLFDVMVIYQKLDLIDHEVEGIKIEGRNGKRVFSKYDLTFSIKDYGSRVKIEMEYSTDLFDRWRIVRMGTHLVELLSSTLDSIDERVGMLRYLPLSEEQEVHAYSRGVSSSKVYEQRVENIFRQRAIEFSNSVAVVCGEIHLTYGKLNEVSDRVASYLQSLGVKEETLIPILSDRSADLLACMLGIMKSGCVYVPLDPSSPVERLKLILRNCGGGLLLAEEGLKEKLDLEDMKQAGVEYRLISLSEAMSGFHAEPVIHEDISRLAYVMFTSGSTGIPKGVMLEHKGLSNHIASMIKDLCLSRTSVLGQTASQGFDISMWQFLSSLMVGGRVVIYPSPVISESGLLLELLVRDKVTVAQFVPSYLEVLLERIEHYGEGSGLGDHLNYMVTIGEVLKPSVAARWFRYFSRPILNTYGPTESSDTVTHSLIEGTGSVSIGKPIDNISVYVLSSDGKLCGAGMRGEICIGGAGVGRGYMNNASLTSEVFVRSGFTEDLFYRTGDAGSYSEDGRLWFHGRLDSQLKINGNRVEPGEIENVMLQLAGIREAAVVSRVTKEGRVFLAGFYISSDGGPVNLRKDLSLHLPSYMVPEALIELEEFPLNANGKVNRRDLSTRALEVEEKEFSDASTGTEKSLLTIWQDLLGLSSISTSEDFFTLGGHSLKAIRMSSRVQKDLGVHITMREIFEHPTITGLSELIDSRQPSRYEPIPRAPLQMSYSLSHAQQRMWMLSEFDPTSSVYNLGRAYDVNGSLNVEAVSKSFDLLVERHEILRTVFKVDSGEASQQVLDKTSCGFKLDYRDLIESSDQSSECDRLVSDILYRPYSLSGELLFRVLLVRRSGGSYVLAFGMHHIISDGWSLDILFRESMSFYTSLIRGLPLSKRPLAIHYKDYSYWQQDELNSSSIDASRRYWHEEFSGGVPVVDIYSDRPRPQVMSHRGDVHCFWLDEELSDGIRSRCSQAGSSLYIYIMSVIRVLLYRHSGQRDIVIGSPMTGRTHPDLEDQIGFYVNTLALRGEVLEEETFGQLLGRMRDKMLLSYEHQVYPFDLLVEELKVERDMSRSPLFDVMVIYQKLDLIDHEVEGIKIEGRNGKRVFSKYDLTFSIKDYGSRVKIEMEYSTDLFDRWRIVRMGTHLVELLSSTLDSIDERVGMLRYLPLSEEQEVHAYSRGVSSSKVYEQRVENIFRQRAIEFSNSVAVVCGEIHLTYGKLNEVSDRVASYLQSLGVKEETLIPILSDRSADLLACMLGIMKSGCVYVPLDPSSPVERLKLILRNCGGGLLLAEEGLKEKLDLEDMKQAGVEYRLISLSEAMSGFHAEPVIHEDISRLAYVMFTSGSTGIPKGVMLEHKGLSNHIASMIKDLCLSRTSVLGQTASQGFDISMWQFLSSLMVGGRVVIYPSPVISESGLLLELLVRDKVTVAQFVPSYLEVLLERIEHYGEGSGLGDHLNYMVTIGEVLKPSVAARWFRYFSRPILNTYGPTESSDTVTHSLIEGTGSVSIGKPIDNISVYVLSSDGKLCGAGMRGEICIGGAGVGRGYMNNASLTSEVFVRSGFTEDLFYRTGDAGSYSEDGRLWFHGRLDSQLKINGNRVEPGEIENVMLQLAGIREAAVVSRVTKEGRVFLAGFYISSDGGPVNLRKDLSLHLPSYMVPEALIELEEFPLNANGKVNRRDLSTRALEVEEKEFSDASTGTEKSLLTIWQDLLGLSSISTSEDFFTLGGHSLKAIRMSSRVQKDLGVHITMREIFEHPTITGLSELIDSRQPSRYEPIPRAPLQMSYSLSHAQQRMWFAVQASNNPGAFTLSLAKKITGPLEIERLSNAFGTLVDRHEILRTIIVEIEGEQRQKIIRFDKNLFRISVHYPGDENENLAEKIANASFYIDELPLVRLNVIVVDKEIHTVILSVHHIIADGWSMARMFLELCDYYNHAKPLELNVQYKDYAEWHSQRVSAQRQEQALFWRRKLGNVHELLLPYDGERPIQKTYNTKLLKFPLDDALRVRIQNFAIAHQMPEAPFFLASLGILLKGLSNEARINVGMPIAGRNHPDLDNQLGFYVNMLTVPLMIEDHHTFADVLKNTLKNFIAVSSRQDYPFDCVVEDVVTRIDPSRSPLFDVEFDYHDFESLLPKTTGELTIEDLEIVRHAGGKYDMDFIVEKTGGKLTLKLYFNTDLFRESTVQEWGSRFIQIIDTASNNEQQIVADLKIIHSRNKFRVRKTNDKKTLQVLQRLSELKDKL